MKFPQYRARRLRKTEALRDLVRETALSTNDFVLPLFIRHGNNVRYPITSMPGHFQFSVDCIVDEVQKAHQLGIKAFLLFGVPASKDPVGSEACNPKGIVQEAIRAVKKGVPDVVVVTDVCLCEYTSHGHCGVIKEKQVDNDATLELLSQMALSHAEAGVDMVAPSDMMDGRVAAIRARLDGNGFSDLPIMSYAAKFASSFYGPFREAAESAPQFGDRKSYQMDPANGREALREIFLDIAEDADIVMVKPALPYLDVISRVRAACDLPVAAYNVSGEFAMVKAASEKGWLDGDLVMMESLLSIKRAGADIIITYFAKEAAELLRK